MNAFFEKQNPLEMKKKYYVMSTFLLAMAVSVSAQDLQFEEAQITLPTIEGPTLAFSDVDGDGDQDFYVTGYDMDVEVGEDPLQGHLFLNDGLGNFTESTENSFVGGFRTLKFIDVDGDGDEDLFSTVEFDGTKVQLYINDGNGVFTDEVTTAFDNVLGSTFEFADIDGDNDPDLIISNDENFGGATRLYLNDGAGVFTENLDAGFVGIKFGDIACADVDGDGDMDVMISGVTIGNTYLLEAYINDGSGSFTNVSGAPFSEDYGDMEFADIDNDGDMDMISSEFSAETIKVYENNGIGLYSESTTSSFAWLNNRAFRVLDIDNDNDMDIMLVGLDMSVFDTEEKAIIYTNDGTGVFTEATGTGIAGFTGNATFDLADVNGDGGLDLLMQDLDVDKLYLNISPGLDIVENNFVNLFEVYPNPTSRDVNLHFETVQKELVMSLTDVYGKLIERVNYKETAEVQYELKQSTGIYFLEVVSGDQRAVVKLIKE